MHWYCVAVKLYGIVLWLGVGNYQVFHFFFFCENSQTFPPNHHFYFLYLVVFYFVVHGDGQLSKQSFIIYNVNKTDQL